MKNKLNHKIRKILAVSFVIMFSLLLGTKYAVNNYYIRYKFTQAEQHFKSEQSVTSEKMYSYLISNGFYVTNQISEIQSNTNYHVMDDGAIMSNSEMSIECCTFGEDVNYLTITENTGNGIAYATINSFILTDINIILNLTLAITLFIYLLITILIEINLSNSITKRIRNIPVALANKDNKNYQIDDEITDVFNQLSHQAEIIDQHTDDTKAMMRAISHELKAPIVNIEALLKMHEKKYKGYEDLPSVLSKIFEQTAKLNNDITKLVSFYDIKHTQYVQDYDLVQMLLMSIKENKEIALQHLAINVSGEFWISGDESVINFICGNIVSNIGKYAKPATVIKIQASNHKLIIVNSIGEVNNDNSNFKGNEITDFFCNKLKVDYTYQITSNLFETIITKKE